MSYPSLDPLLTVPYVSVPEFKASPTWLDLDDLIEGGVQAQQDAELTNQLIKASAWADKYVRQPLRAHYQVENKQCRMDKWGRIWIHPSHAPIRSIAALSYGTDIWNMTSITSLGASSSSGAQAWVEDSKGVIVALSGISNTWAGSLQFGGVPPPATEMYVQIEYVAGYGHGVLASSTTAGSSTVLQLDSSLGFQPPAKSFAGNTYGASIARIWDPASEEAATVTAVDNTDNQITVAKTQYDHQVGVNVSELPAEVKQAVTQYAAGLLLRQDVTNDMPFSGAPGPSARRSHGRGVAGGLINEAECSLKDYRRVR